jgi:hypothetical protein
MDWKIIDALPIAKDAIIITNRVGTRSDKIY